MPVHKDNQRGTWYFALRYTDITGKSKQAKRRGFSTKRAATTAEREFLNTLNNGTQTHVNSKISEIIDSYLEDKAKIVKGSTHKALVSALNGRVRHFLGDVKIADLKNTHIVAFHDFMLNPPVGSEFRKTQISTAQEIHSILIAMLKYAEKHYDITPVAHKFTPPKHHHSSVQTKHKNMHYYTLQQFEELISLMRTNNDVFIADIIEMLYYTGMRISELLALTYNYIDFTNNKILVRQNIITINEKNGNSNFKDIISTPKTQSSIRDISLPDRAIDLLKSYYAADSAKKNFDSNWFIFSETKFEHFSYTTLRHRYNAAFARTGMPRITMHDFRHSHVSLLINSGADALLVKERLGHSSVTTTLDTYSHFFPEREDTILQKLNKMMPR